MTEIAKRACVHVNYTVSNKSKQRDLCLIKEHIYHPDGTIEPAITLAKNHRRDFYITAPVKQDHKSKKEWERIRHCNRYECTQATLIDTLARVLHTSPKGLRRLNRNQFVYGTDVDIASIVKHRYHKGFPEAVINPTIAYMDYEWHIASRDLSVGVMVFNEHGHLTVDKSIFKNIPNAAQRLQECFDTYLVPYIEKYYEEAKIPVKERRKYKLHVDLVDTPIEVTSKLFSYSHIYKPDYMTFWNGESDFSTIELACKRANVDMASFTCDPTVPPEYRNAEFVRDKPYKLDTNGNEKKIKAHERWHVFNNMASWQFLDLMCTYAANRAHKPQLSSYGLDAALEREIKLRKFKFSDHIESLNSLTVEEWHNVMVRDYPVEYCIYAMFDCIGPQLLEDKTADIRGQFYPKLGISPIQNFKKNPRRIADKMHFELLSKGYVVGSTSDQMIEETDNLLYSADEIIITLSSDTHYNMGVNCLSDCPEIVTSFIPKSADADIKSSYPTNQRILNLSKTTRYTELFKIDTLSISLGKEIGMNIASGKGSAIDVCYRVYQLPHLKDWSDRYRSKHRG